MTPAQRLRNILGGSAGNFVEWFDWFAYSAFAIYFSRAFFPAGDQTAQLLSAAAIFAVGFIARPVGALLFGMYADRAGRRTALTLSVAMMCGGSLMIALIPTGLGLLSPALLLVARLLQGLSVGGEYGASATYISEMAERTQRGFWSGFLYVTLTGGQLAALLLQVLLQQALSEQQLYAWGWRIPFVVGALLAVVVWWIRRGIHETHSFTQADVPERERGRAFALFAQYPKVLGDHHLIEFLTDYLRLMVSGNMNSFEIENLMDNEIETHHHEAHSAVAALQRLAGALPAFGIVAAVLGVVNTMGSVGQPPAVLGAMIGSALVGTFLGILLAYAFAEPLAGLLEQKVDEAGKELQCIKTTLLASMQGYAPQVAIEFGRKVLYSTERPTFAELEGHVKGKK
jgi:flagellar motor component MotA/uncharacterized integral membrane protein